MAVIRTSGIIRITKSEDNNVGPLQLYDELCQYAGSVLVVHPPHVTLITRSQVTPAPTAGAV